MVRILSLDDDRQVLEVIHLVLQSSGYDHVYTTNSFEAFSILQRESVDLFTQDWSRSDIDGMTFYRRMKREEDLYDLPILMITASDVMLDEAMTELLFSGRPAPRVRGFHVAAPEHQSALSLLAERVGVQVAIVDGYLPKPCTAHDLVVEVDRILKSRAIPLPPEEERIVSAQDFDPNLRIFGRGSDYLRSVD